MILGKKNIVLVGMTGVGKTTIGRILSKILKKKFIDIDFEIERASGQKVFHIFERYGEIEFRKIEKKIIVKSINSSENSVISSGAGILNNIETLDLIKNTCISVFLDIKLSTLVDRLKNNTKNRPMLDNGDLEENLKNMYYQRIENYKKSNIKITVDGLSPSDIVKRIIRKIKYYQTN